MASHSTATTAAAARRSRMVTVFALAGGLIGALAWQARAQETPAPGTAAPAAASDAVAATGADTGADTGAAVGATGATTVTHAISTFGTPKYGPDADRLDYVNPDAPQGGEMSIWTSGTFDSMNPYTRKGRAGALASVFFEDMLTGTADEIGSVYCLLCETMEFPEDKAWVIFTLREGVRFSDGTPMTAEDVFFTYDLFMREGLPSFRAVIPQTVASAEVLDDRRIKYTFVPDSPLRDRIQTAGGLPVASKKWFVDNDAGLDESRLEPAVGSGPYVLDNYDINQRIVYRKNPDYWGQGLWLNRGRNNFETIRVEYFGDSIAAFEGFKSGAYAFRVENSSKEWATSYDFPAISDGTIVKAELADGTIASGQSYAMNLRRPQFQDPRVREAIGLMFNFEWSNETLFYGLYERIESFWENSDLAATGTPSPEETAILQPLVDEGLLDASILTDEAVAAPVSGARQLDRGNLRLASDLLDAAGWLVGDDGLRRKDGQTLKLEILEDSPTFDRVHMPFIQNLQALGVDATYNRVDPSQYTDLTRSHQFDVIVKQFPMGYEPGSGLQQYFGSGSVDDLFNSMGLADPAVDRLISVVEEADTQDALTPAVRALDRVLRAKRFWVPQWYKDVHTVAYYNHYEYPDPLPPFSLGHLDFWWSNPEKEAALKAQGALR